MALLSVVVTHMLYNTYKRTACSSYVCMCMGAYILWCARRMAPFSHNSPNSVTPSQRSKQREEKISQRAPGRVLAGTLSQRGQGVSPGNPHKCTVGKTVLSRDQPGVIRPPQMTRQAGKRELHRVASMCWAGLLTHFLRMCTRSACSCVHNVYCI